MGTPGGRPHTAPIYKFTRQQIFSLYSFRPGNIYSTKQFTISGQVFLQPQKVYFVLAIKASDGIWADTWGECGISESKCLILCSKSH